MVAATVDTHEIDEMARRYATIESVMEREMHTAMVRATAQVQHDAQAAVVVDQGTLRRSITTDVTPYVGRVGTNLPYARGRRPGKMPPPGAILGWMRRHGIDAKKEFPIRLKISRRGVKLPQYLEPALEKNRTAINKEFTLAEGRALAQLGRGT